jgi:hypothetical protein
MTEKEPRETLPGRDAAQPADEADARRLARKVLERDGRRIRILAGLTIALWAVAAAGISLALCALLAFRPGQGNLARDVQQGRITLAERRSIERAHWMTIEKMTAVVAVSVAILALAALGTVFLALASRGATIRQVNSALLQISEELKQLKQDSPPPGRPVVPPSRARLESEEHLRDI